MSGTDIVNGEQGLVVSGGGQDGHVWVERGICTQWMNLAIGNECKVDSEHME